MEKLTDIQVAMHKNLFDRCRMAIDNGCYFEAIMLEYAAIEGRLEVMLSLMGMPCGKDCMQKKDIKISSRIQCLNHIRNNTFNYENSKLEKNYFSEKGVLKSWLKERDILVHGLFKRPEDYIQRVENAKQIADDGFDIVRKLYNDARRLRRLKNNHPEKFSICSGMCRNKSCIAYDVKEE